MLSPSFKKKLQSLLNADSITEFKMFEGRGHYICGDDNWEEVATYVYNWINK